MYQQRFRHSNGPRINYSAMELMSIVLCCQSNRHHFAILFTGVFPFT